MGRLADRGNRPFIIAASLAVFSAMTAACALAQSFWHLLLTRVGVAIGEAGTNPSSYSIISDLYPKSERAGAMAMLTIGGNVGVLLGFVIGGAIAAQHGWRAAFVVVGLPGLLLAAIVAIFFKDSIHRPSSNGESSPGQHPTLAETMSFLWRQRTFRHVLLGGSLALFVFNGVVAWLPSYLDRSHGLAPFSTGATLGLTFGLGGIFGTLAFGGKLIDKLSRLDPRWATWIVGGSMVCAGMGHLAVFATHDKAILFASLIIPAILGAVFQAPTLTITQAISPPTMRATAGACLLLGGNLIGLGLGPLFVGALSDIYTQLGAGAEGLRWALCSLLPFTLWGAGHYFWASRSLRRDIAFAEMT
jgi:MFS family permease